MFAHEGGIFDDAALTAQESVRAGARSKLARCRTGFSLSAGEKKSPTRPP
jgi:hypothetical protein